MFVWQVMSITAPNGREIDGVHLYRHSFPVSLFVGQVLWICKEPKCFCEVIAIALIIGWRERDAFNC